jgi:hypothetical protein
LLVYPYRDFTIAFFWKNLEISKFKWVMVVTTI